MRFQGLLKIEWAGFASGIEVEHERKGDKGDSKI